MPCWSTARTAAVLAVLALSACDAGHRDEPGLDNKWTGPELAIQLPGPSTTIRYDLTEEGWAAYKAREHDPIRAMVHLRALSEVDGVVVRYAVDDGPFRAVPDPMKPFDLPRGLVPGTHLVSAYVANEAGEPHGRSGPKSVCVAEFHVQVDVTRKDGSIEKLGGPSNTYGHQVEGTYRPFDRRAPQLVVDRRGPIVNVLVANAQLGEDTFRVRWADGEMTEGVAGVVGLEDPSTPVTFTLERKVGDAWERVPGARSLWPMPR